MSQRRIPCVVAQLEQLPTEIIEMVLKDLSLAAVLDIEKAGSKRLHDCIFDSPSWRTLCQEPGRFDDLSKLRTLYVEIQDILLGKGWRATLTRAQDETLLSRKKMYSPGWYFERVDGILRFHPHDIARGRHDRMLDDMKNWVHHLLSQMLHGMSRAEITMIQRYAEGSFILNFDPLPKNVITAGREALDNLNTADAALNKAKAIELKEAAQLLKQYPQLLKPLRDPHQLVRPNQSHILSRLETEAITVLKDRICALRHRDRPSYRFDTDNFPLVPFDWTLSFFLFVVHRFPLPHAEANRTPIEDLSVAFFNMTIPDVNPNDLYPPHISQQVADVLHGLTHLFMHPRPIDTKRIWRRKGCNVVHFPLKFQTRHGYRDLRGGERNLFYASSRTQAPAIFRIDGPTLKLPRIIGTSITRPVEVGIQLIKTIHGPGGPNAEDGDKLQHIAKEVKAKTQPEFIVWSAKSLGRAFDAHPPEEARWLRAFAECVTYFELQLPEIAAHYRAIYQEPRSPEDFIWNRNPRLVFTYWGFPFRL